MVDVEELRREIRQDLAAEVATQFAKMLAALKPKMGAAAPRQFYTLNSARRVAGCRAEDIQGALEQGLVVGAVKLKRGRTGKWKIPSEGLVAWIRSRVAA